MASKNITNKEIAQRSNPGYMVFFDDIRVDSLVPSYTVNLSSNGSYGSASITMLYHPDLDKICHNFNEPKIIKHEVDNVNSDSTSKTFYIDDGVENMTNVRVFCKNPFSDKYIQIFEGNIRGKSFSMQKGGRSITFNAYDYMNWMNRIFCPWSTAINDSIFSVDLMSWAAYGIDTKYAANNFLNSNQQEMKGQSIAQAINTVLQYSYLNNKFLQEKDCVLAWDKPLLRFMLMGDIAENLRNENFWGYVVSTQANHTDSFYLKMQQVLQNLIFEYFQDRDGLIRIKPPFWNKDVLQDHMIDSTLIESYTDNVNWNNFYTRVICKGGSDQVYNTTQSAIDKITTPAAIATFSGEVVSQRTLLSLSEIEGQINSNSPENTESNGIQNGTDVYIKSKVKSANFIKTETVSLLTQGQLENAVESYLKKYGGSDIERRQINSAKNEVKNYISVCTEHYNLNPVFFIVKDIVLTRLGASVNSNSISKYNWGNYNIGKSSEINYPNVRSYIHDLLNDLDSNYIKNKGSYSMEEWFKNSSNTFNPKDDFLNLFSSTMTLLLQCVQYQANQTNLSVLGIDSETAPAGNKDNSTVTAINKKTDPNSNVTKGNVSYNKNYKSYSYNKPDGTRQISVVTPNSAPGNSICMPFGKQKIRCTSIFGRRGAIGSGWHQGIDIIPIGGDNSVHAVMGGEVTNAGYDSSMGNYVRIKQWDGYTARYMHMKGNSLRVKSGEKVKTGQIVGTMGNTGCSGGAHLHLDFVWPKGTAVSSSSIHNEKRLTDHFANPFNYLGLSKQSERGYPKWGDTFNGADNVPPWAETSSGNIPFVNDENGANETATNETGISYTVDENGNLVYTLNTGDAIMSFTDNPNGSTDFLLKLGELEKRYGPLIHSVTQPMIKFENGGTGEDYVNNATDNNDPITVNEENKAYDALIEYSRFTLNYLNASSNIADLTTICMPWLRPGTNVWVDPEGVDKVYYLTGVTHYGSVKDGCHSSLNLSIGRLRQNFLNKTSAFGSRKESSEDIFINEVYMDIDSYGKIVSDYEDVKRKLTAYHQTSGASIGNLYHVQKASDESNPLKQYYVNNDDKVKRYKTQMKTTDMRTGEAGHNFSVDEEFLVFDGEYTENQVEEALKEYYDDAPDVVKKRRNRLKEIINNAKKHFSYLTISEK